MEIPQVFGRNGGWRVLEQRPRCSGLRKSDHIAQRRRAGEHHRDSVHSECNAAVRGRPGAQRVQQKAEPELRGLRVDSEERQHLPLQGRIVDTNAPSTELRAIEHDIVSERTNFFRRRIEKLDVLGIRRRERVMHGAECATLLADEQWKIGNPEKRPLVFGHH